MQQARDQRLVRQSLRERPLLDRLQVLCVESRMFSRRSFRKVARGGISMKMPQRSEILQAVDRFEKRDPELHRELRRKATEPPDDEAVFPIARKAAEVLEELEPKRDADDAGRPRRATMRAAPGEGGAVEEGILPRPSAVDDEVTAYERRVAETIVRPSARPVLAIRDNKVTTEFLGPDSETWAARIDGARTVLDAVIPAIGRVELKNNAVMRTSRPARCLYPLAEPVAAHLERRSIGREGILAHQPWPDLLSGWKRRVVLAVIEADFEEPVQSCAEILVRASWGDVPVLDPLEVLLCRCPGYHPVPLADIVSADFPKVVRFVLVEDRVAPVVVGF